MIIVGNASVLAHVHIGLREADRIGEAYGSLRSPYRFPR